MNPNKYKVELTNKVSNITKKNIYKKYIIFVTGILIIVITLFIIITRNMKYEQALKNISVGEYEKAYVMLEELGSPKAINKLKENKYERANEFLKSNDDISALILFNEILDYKDSKNQKDEILKDKKYLKIFISKPDDEITFGEYEQDNDTTNGKEKLEWIVMHNNNKKVYMVSKYVIDAMKYNTANGDGSTLKKWLMEDFTKETFDDDERKLVSHVGLLSKEDMKQYGKMIGTKPVWTIYAMAQEPSKEYMAGYSWWLAGEYTHGFATTEVLMDIVTESGAYGSYVSSITERNGVRPAIIIDASENDIDYYSEDYEEMENSGVVTRTKSDADREVANILEKSSYSSSNKKSSSSNSSTSSGQKRVCDRCKGRGKYRIWNRKEETECSRCRGTGYLSH